MRKRTKIILLLILTVVGLVAAGILYKREGARQYLEKELKAADAFLREASAKEFTRPAFEPWPDDVPMADRATDARAIYERAGLLAHEALEAWDAYMDEQDLEVEDPVHVYDDELEGFDDGERAQWRELAHRLLDRHAEPLRTLRSALHVERIKANPELIHGVEGDLEPIAHQQSISEFLTVAGMLHRDEQTVDAALDVAGLAILMGHDLARGDGLVRHLIRSGRIENEAELCQHVLASGLPSEAALVRLRAILAHVRATEPSWADCWRVEGALLRRTTAHAFLTGGDEAGDAGMAQLWIAELLGAMWLRALEGPLARLVEIGELPPREAYRQAVALDDEQKGNDFVRMTTSLAPVVFARRMTAARDLLLLDAATAIALHRKRTGHWPESLGMLGLDKEICPVSEGPLRYEPGKVWSIGGDGKDDGGDPRDPDADWDAEGDDVWDLTKAR